MMGIKKHENKPFVSEQEQTEGLNTPTRIWMEFFNSSRAIHEIRSQRTNVYEVSEHDRGVLERAREIAVQSTETINNITTQEGELFIRAIGEYVITGKQPNDDELKNIIDLYESYISKSRITQTLRDTEPENAHVLRDFVTVVQELLTDTEHVTHDRIEEMVNIWKYGATSVEMEEALDDEVFQNHELFGKKIEFVRRALHDTRLKIASVAPEYVDHVPDIDEEEAIVMRVVETGSVSTDALKVSDGILEIMGTKMEHLESVARFELQNKANVLQAKAVALEGVILNNTPGNNEMQFHEIAFHIDALKKEKEQLVNEYANKGIRSASVTSIVGARVSNKRIDNLYILAKRYFENSTTDISEAVFEKSEMKRKGHIREIMNAYKCILSGDTNGAVRHAKQSLNLYCNVNQKPTPSERAFFEYVRNNDDGINPDVLEAKIYAFMEDMLRSNQEARVILTLSRMERSRLLAIKYKEKDLSRVMQDSMRALRETQESVSALESAKRLQALEQLTDNPETSENAHQNDAHTIAKELARLALIDAESDSTVVESLSKALKNIPSGVFNEIQKLIESGVGPAEIAEKLEEMADEARFKFRPETVLSSILSLIGILGGMSVSTEDASAQSPHHGGHIESATDSSGVRIYTRHIGTDSAVTDNPELHQFLLETEATLYLNPTEGEDIFERSSILLANGKLYVSKPHNAPKVLARYMNTLSESERLNHMKYIAETCPNLVNEKGEFAPTSPLTVSEYIHVYSRFIQELSEYDDVLHSSSEYLNKTDKKSFLEFSRDINKARQEHIDEDLQHDRVYNELVRLGLDEDADIHRYGLVIINLMRGDHWFGSPVINPDVPNFREKAIARIEKIFTYMKYMYMEYYGDRVSKSVIDEMFEASFREINAMTDSEFRSLIKTHRNNVWKLSEAIITHYLYSKLDLEPIRVPHIGATDLQHPDMRTIDVPTQEEKGGSMRYSVSLTQGFPVSPEGKPFPNGQISDNLSLRGIQTRELEEAVRNSAKEMEQKIAELQSAMGELKKEFDEQLNTNLENLRSTIKEILLSHIKTSDLYNALAQSDPTLQESFDALVQSVNGISSDADSWKALSSSMRAFANAYQNSVTMSYILGLSGAESFSTFAVGETERFLKGVSDSMAKAVSESFEHASAARERTTDDIQTTGKNTAHTLDTHAQRINEMIRNNAMEIVTHSFDVMSEEVRAATDNFLESFMMPLGYEYGDFSEPSKFAVIVTPYMERLYSEYLGEDIGSYFEKRGRWADFDKKNRHYSMLSLASFMYDYGRIVDAMREKGVSEDELPKLGELISGFNVAYVDSETAWYAKGMTSFDYSFDLSVDAEGNSIYTIAYEGVYTHKDEQDVAKGVVLPKGKLVFVNPEISEREDGSREFTYSEMRLIWENPDASKGDEQPPMVVSMKGVSIVASEESIPRWHELVVNDASTGIRFMGKSISPDSWLKETLSRFGAGEIHAQEISYTLPDGSAGDFSSVDYNGEENTVSFGTYNVFMRSGIEGEETRVKGTNTEVSRLVKNPLEYVLTVDSESIVAEWADSFFNALELYVRANVSGGVVTEAEVRALAIAFIDASLSIKARGVNAFASVPDGEVRAKAESVAIQTADSIKRYIENADINISNGALDVSGSLFTVDANGLARIIKDARFEFNSIQDYALSGALIITTASDYATALLDKSIEEGRLEGGIGALFESVKNDLTLKESDKEGVYILGSIQRKGEALYIHVPEAYAVNWNNEINAKLEELSVKYTDDQIKLALMEFELFLEKQHANALLTASNVYGEASRSGIHITAKTLGYVRKSMEGLQEGDTPEHQADLMIDAYIHQLYIGMKQGRFDASVQYARVVNNREALRSIVVRDLGVALFEKSATFDVADVETKISYKNALYSSVLSDALLAFGVTGEFDETSYMDFSLGEISIQNNKMNTILEMIRDNDGVFTDQEFEYMTHTIEEGFASILAGLESSMRTSSSSVDASLAIRYAAVARYKSIVLATLNNLKATYKTGEGILVSADKIQAAFSYGANEIMASLKGEGLLTGINWEGSNGWNIMIGAKNLEFESENQSIAIKNLVLELSQRGVRLDYDSIEADKLQLSDAQRQLLESFGFSLDTDEQGNIIGLSIEQAMFLRSVEDRIMQYLTINGLEIKDGKIADLDKLELILNGKSGYKELLDVLFEKSITENGESAYSVDISLSDIVNLTIDNYMERVDDKETKQSIEKVEIEVKNLLNSMVSDLYRTVNESGTTYGADLLTIDILNGAVNVTVEKIIRQYKTDGTTETTISSIMADVVGALSAEFRNIKISETENSASVFAEYIKISADALRSSILAENTSVFKDVSSMSFESGKISFDILEGVIRGYIEDARYMSTSYDSGASRMYEVGVATISIINQFKLSLEKKGYLTYDSETGKGIVNIAGGVEALNIEFAKTLKALSNFSFLVDTKEDILQASFDFSGVLNERDMHLFANVRSDTLETGINAGAKVDMGAFLTSLSVGINVHEDTANVSLFGDDGELVLTMQVKTPDKTGTLYDVVQKALRSSSSMTEFIASVSESAQKGMDMARNIEEGVISIRPDALHTMFIPTESANEAQVTAYNVLRYTLVEMEKRGEIQSDISFTIGDIQQIGEHIKEGNSINALEIAFEKITGKSMDSYMTSVVSELLYPSTTSLLEGVNETVSDDTATIRANVSRQMQNQGQYTSSTRSGMELSGTFGDMDVEVSAQDIRNILVSLGAQESGETTTAQLALSGLRLSSLKAMFGKGYEKELPDGSTVRISALAGVHALTAEFGNMQNEQLAAVLYANTGPTGTITVPLTVELGTPNGDRNTFVIPDASMRIAVSKNEGDDMSASFSVEISPKKVITMEDGNINPKLSGADLLAQVALRIRELGSVTGAYRSSTQSGSIGMGVNVLDKLNVEAGAHVVPGGAYPWIGVSNKPNMSLWGVRLQEMSLRASANMGGGGPGASVRVTLTK